MSTKAAAAPKKTISKQGAGQLSLRGFFAPKPATSTPSTKTESPLSPETDPKTTRPEAAPPAKTDTPLKLDKGLAAAPSPQANTSTPSTQPIATDDAAVEPAAKPAAKPAAPASEPAAKRAAPPSDKPSKKRAAPAAQPGKRRPVCIAESESDGDEHEEEEESGSDEDEEDYEDEDSDEDAPLSAKPPAKKPAAAKKPAPASKQDAPKNPFAAKPATASAGSSSAVGSDHAAEILEAACTANAANPRKVGRSAREDGGPAAEDEGPDGGKTVSYGFLRDKQDAQGRRPGEEGFDKSTLLVKLRKDERFTPGQQQYWDIKKGYADMVVFFKMGKFYELFEEDALLCHRELDLAFMGKGAPHVGFPESSLRKYSDKLVAMGHKVGVVEQMETPAELEERNKLRPKGQKKESAVRREMCEVRTLGTNPESEKAQATYLLSVTEDPERGLLGVCFVDAATGHFTLGQCSDDPQKNCLRTLLAQLRPSEVIFDQSHGSRESYLLLRRSVQENLLSTVSDATQFWGADDAARELGKENYFKGGEDAWPAPLREAAAMKPPLALGAYGACVGYLKRLLLDKQLVPLGSMAKWQPTDEIGSLAADGHVVLDSKALNNLEVFENTFDRGSAGTLFEILNHTCSAFGARLLREWLCAPPRRIEDIEARQQSIAAVMEHGEVRDVLRPVLKKLPDLERLLARVHGFAGKQAKNSATHYEDIGKAKLGCFIKVLEGFEMLDGAVQKLKPQLGELKKAAPRLAQSLTHGEGFPDLSSALAYFRECFDWSLASKEGRVVPKLGADKEYDAADSKIKAAVAELKRIERHWQAELRDQSICFWTPQLQTTEPFQLAVSEETLRKRGTPEEFEMKSSKKGTKRFWTEEIEEQVAVYIEGKAEQERALGGVASKLFGDFSSRFALWRNGVGAAAELDCLLSLAAVSAAPHMCRPTFAMSETPFLAITAGVNPCVQHSLGSKDCIPNDISIGTEASTEAGAEADAPAGQPPLLLVTGPNMGGKSTLLRQACLTVLMAHLGCWVPAEACRLSPVDRVFTRVGANDAIMAGLSTFRVELEETALILRHATRHSLVILDELGRGTATFDGMAIADAVLRELVSATKCRALFATHYHALTREHERPNPHVGLYHMACSIDDATRAVTFLYKFAAGASARSHGVHVARLAGLPEPLLVLAAAKSDEMEAALEQKHLLHLGHRLASIAATGSADEARALRTAAQALPTR